MIKSLSLTVATLLLSSIAMAEYSPVKICQTFNRQTGALVDTIQAGVFAEQVDGQEGQEPTFNVVFALVEQGADGNAKETQFMASPLVMDQDNIVLDLMGANFNIGNNGVESDSGAVRINRVTLKDDQGQEVKVWVGAAFVGGSRYNLLCE